MFKFLTTAKKRLKKFIVPRPPVPFARPVSTQEQAALELVERARQGEQNALATIVATRDAAIAGNPVSQQAFARIVQCVKKTPLRQMVSFGAEQQAEHQSNELALQASQALQSGEYPKALVEHIAPLALRSPQKAIVTVANGPTLLTADGMKPRLMEMAEQLAPNQRSAFAAGVKHCERVMHYASKLPPDCRQALMLGVILGMARRLQAVRIDTAPLNILCPVAAWELGE